MESHETPPEGDEELRAEMSAADINDLPDSDFAYIEDGGEKDSDGKTVPRSLRHFPIHDAAHVRNALARAPQSPFGDKAMPKIKAAAKKFGIDAQQNAVQIASEIRHEVEAGVITVDEARERLKLPPLEEGRPTNRALTAAAERRKKQRHRAVALLPEVRHLDTQNLEVRDAGGSGDTVRIVGTPVVFDTPYIVTDMLGSFEERMAPGVASDVLPTADVRFLIDHDASRLLARTVSGTLQLSEDERGIQMAATVDLRDSDARNLMVRLERGDVSQMSCGFIVGSDEWSEDWDQRTIHRFAEFLDVSAVTYPCSPTTSVQIAQRMALRMPIESQARVDKAYRDIRAGKVLSSANQDKLVSALGALHDLASAGGVDLSQVDADGATDDAAEPDANVSPDGTTGGNDTADTGLGAQGFAMDGARSQGPGEPIKYHRKAPETAAERREQSGSFGDRESAVYSALCDRFGGFGCADIWIVDCGEDWVVWDSFGPGQRGMYRLAYTADANGAVTLADGPPEAVVTQTSYVPAARNATRPKSAAAIDQAWLDSLVERGEGLHGSARKRIAA